MLFLNRHKRMTRFIIVFFVAASTIIGLAEAAKKPDPPPAAPPPPGFERITDPAFTLDKPLTWNLYRSGDCDRMNLFVRDSSEPLRQIFFFPRVGPVYMTQEQKFLDLQYENISGQQLSRRDMPIVNPFGPENFLRYLPQVLQMQLMREAMPERPTIRVLDPFALSMQKKALDYTDAQTAVIRAVIVQDNRLAEGLFVITTLPSPDFRTSAGGGIGMGFLLFGVTAPKGELATALPSLLMIARSLNLNANYVKSCKKTRAIDSPDLLGENQSLTSYTNLLSTYWEKRNPTDDTTAEQKAKQLRGLE
jgi:hypothetical protein